MVRTRSISRTPSPRSVRRAVDLLAQLPAEAMRETVEAMIARLDAATLDPDLEDGDDAEVDNDDCCEAADDDPALSLPRLGDTPMRVREDDAEPSVPSWGGRA